MPRRSTPASALRSAGDRAADGSRAVGRDVEPVFQVVAAGLQEHQLVTTFAKSVDEDAAVTVAVVGDVLDSGAEEGSDALVDLHLVTQQPPGVRASRAVADQGVQRHLRGVADRLALTLSEVLISTGTPVIAANADRTSATNGFCSRVTARARVVAFVCTIAGILSATRTTPFRTSCGSTARTTSARRCHSSGTR
jgi:hypothetical protein